MTSSGADRQPISYDEESKENGAQASPEKGCKDTLEEATSPSSQGTPGGVCQEQSPNLTHAFCRLGRLLFVLP